MKYSPDGRTDGPAANNETQKASYKIARVHMELSRTRNLATAALGLFLQGILLISLLRSRLIMGRLTTSQIKSYRDNGYVLVKNVFSTEELDEMSEEYDQLFRRHNPAVMENSWVGSNETNRVTEDNPWTVKGIQNMHHHAAVYGRAIYHDGLLDAVADCLGCENILLHHTKAHLKPPEKGGAYPMYQDYHYFPMERDTCLAAFIHLDPASPDNGGLFVYPGSHKLGPQEDVGIKEGNFHYLDKKKFPISKATPVVAERGDVVLFSYLLVHGSPPNVSSRPRRMFLAQFFEAGNKLVTDQRRNPSHGLVLRGVNVYKDASIGKQYDFD